MSGKLKAPIKAVPIHEKNGNLEYGTEQTINPGKFTSTVVSLRHKAETGRVWIRHYDARDYEVDSDDLVKNSDITDWI